MIMFTGLVAWVYHDLHMKSRKVCEKTRSPPASFLFKGQGTEHTTVKWPIVYKIHKESFFTHPQKSLIFLTLDKNLHSVNSSDLGFLSLVLPNPPRLLGKEKILLNEQGTTFMSSAKLIMLL